MTLPVISKKLRFWSVFLTWWIPIKIYRRFFRAIIQFGIRRYLYVIKTDKTRKFEHKIAVGAIMKDEGPYLKEWLDFHILVGIKKFYLYDNESTDNTIKILEPYIKAGIVEYHYITGTSKQYSAYTEILEQHSNDTQYIAFIDLDEFLVPVQQKTIPDFLDTLPNNFACLVISWVLYGSSGHKTKPDGLVIENYKYHSTKKSNVESGVKSIVNPRLIVNLKIHIPFVAGFTYDENGKKLGYINQSYNPPSTHKIRCNHYITKSQEEFQKRISRGGGVHGPDSQRNKKKEKLFDKLNVNTTYDNIMDDYIERVKNFKL